VGLGAVKFTEVEELHRIAVDAGDDYLIAAVAEIKRRGTEMGRLMTEAKIAEDEAKESKRYAEWLKTMFIEPHAECDQMHWDRESKVLAIVRDTSIKPDDKLAQIEDQLTWSDEELADER
jgi:hypothetical protein